MASSSSALFGERSFVNFTSASEPSLERHKLDRLRELRAVIDTLHCEQESRDPLLAWVVARERAETRRRD